MQAEAALNCYIKEGFDKAVSIYIEEYQCTFSSKINWFSYLKKGEEKIVLAKKKFIPALKW